MMEFLTLEIMDNPLSAWLAAILVTLGINVAAVILKRVLLARVLRYAQRTSSKFDDSLIGVLERTRQLLVFVVALYVGTQFLDVAPQTERLLRSAAVVAFFLQVGIWAGALLEYGFRRYGERISARSGGAATSLGVMNFMGKALLWAVLLLVALDNLGIDVTALVAGLGIGGVAVALAVQNVLGDLFASLSIVIDKPFVVGDFVVADEYMGTVEHVGLKTTRLRSLSGEQIVFANSDLLQTRLRNYKRMRERRVVFTLGVLYQTRAELLEQIPAMVKDIVGQQKQTRFDRAHFFRFGESSLDYEVVYWMLDPDYNRYMDVQQAINLAIVRAFAAAGIEFAYPTRTLILSREGSEDADEAYRRGDDERRRAALRSRQ